MRSIFIALVLFFFGQVIKRIEMTPARVDAVPSRMHMAMRVGGIVTSTFIVASGFRFSPLIIRSLVSNSSFPSYVRRARARVHRKY